MTTGTSRWGNARMCCTTPCWAPSTGTTRSQGLSSRNSIATAHSNTARMRRWTQRAMTAFRCQMGVRISSTSALLTSETGILPMRRKSVAFQAAQPVPRVSRTAPAGLLLLQHARSGFGEAGYALGAAFLCQRVTALAC